jgi:predicted pyridoxine 5'-phosphate oxidase superfamily flavin-nucleotide-binding protein
MSAYHERSRELQDRFDSRRLADALAEKLSRTAFSAEDKAFIESRSMFFLATADAEGQPDCSYKGGMPGFVRVSGESELSFPSYDGNGMFRSLGNVLANPRVGLLFLDFEQPRRLRVLGLARLEEPDGTVQGAQLIVRVRAERIFPNCPRYIHRMQLVEPSVYAPRPGHKPPEPAWKKGFREYLPKG